MIVVVDQGGHGAGIEIARSAAAAGGRVELVARVADDPSGDRQLQGLTDARVGHIATLRTPSGSEVTALDAGDAELALRYLSDATTIVLVGPTDPGAVAVAAEAAGWGRGHLLVVLAAGDAVPTGVPEDAIVLEAPRSDPDGAFATLLGSVAARIDAGVDPAAAFAEAVGGAGAWTRLVAGD